jgi:hypothetical protein
MTKQLSPGCSAALGLFFSLIFALIGGYIVAISLDVIHVDPAYFKAPRGIVAMAGMCFFLGGVWAALKSTSWAFGSDTPLVKWLSFLLTLLMMSAFASMFLWTGFGPGDPQFETSTSIGPVTTTGPGNELMGRLLFGGFGVLAGLVTLYYAVTQPLKILGKLPKKKLPGHEQ